MARDPMAVWKLQEKIDYLYFVLGEIQKSFPKNGFERAIDDATGFSDSRNQRIYDTCVEMKKLKARFAKVTGAVVETPMEDGIIAAFEAARDGTKSMDAGVSGVPVPGV